MTKPIIKKPVNTTVTREEMSASLKWAHDFHSVTQGRFSAAQRFVDSEILRYSEKYTPLLSGYLIKSGTFGTYPGEGVVEWIAPYARPQYYRPGKPGTHSGPLRGPFWFGRMKAVNGKTIVAGGKRIAGGG